MEVDELKKINLITRCTLGFVFIYHGLVPKILWLSAIEISLVTAHHLDPTVFSRVAGLLEMMLGLSIILFRNYLLPIYVAITLLVILLVDVAIVMPSLLFEAFNPVTINIALIVIAYIVCITQKTKVLSD